jgi:hypothetical protein
MFGVRRVFFNRQSAYLWVQTGPLLADLFLYLCVSRVAERVRVPRVEQELHTIPT